MTAKSAGDAARDATREHCQVLRQDMHELEPEWAGEAMMLGAALNRALDFLPDGEVHDELAAVVDEHDARVTAWSVAADTYFAALEGSARADAESTPSQR